MGMDVAEGSIAAPNASERRVAMRGSRKSIVEELRSFQRLSCVGKE
jgi:hypothetical protein